MAERTPQQQAQFDAAELINQSQPAKPEAKKVVLEVDNIKSETKAPKIGDK